MNRNIIAFQKNLVILPQIGIDNRVMAMTVQAELMQFGYMLDENAFKHLSNADAADIKDFHNEVIHYLKDITGGLRNYQPIYPGFPQQVMEMSELELWINQIIGYWSGGSFNAPEYPKQKGTAFEHVKYKIIKAGTEDDFKNIFKVLASSGQSLTPSDMKVIKWFIEYYPQIEFPEVIPFKENLCTIFGKMIELGKKPRIYPKLTTTDVLRIIVYLSDGDISLPKVPRKFTFTKVGRRLEKISNSERENFKFKKFNRKERKYLLELLEKSNLDVKEMVLKDQRWIRLGEILHPGDYHVEFPRAYAAFQKLRNDKIRSWYSDVEKAFNTSYEVGLLKLSERPGEFLRKLDYLIRNVKHSLPTVNKILQVLTKVGQKASNKVLFEVYTHFEKRRSHTERSIMIKGARKKTTLPDLSALNSNIVDAVQSTIWDIIKEKFKSLPSLGDCWIDENLKKIPLPTNMRSLNDSLVPTIRGERVPIFNPIEAKTIRCFIHWFDKKGDIDIDLHGYLLGDKHSTSFGYNGDRSNNIGCYSGDVRYRKGACAEYVDIKVSETIKQGYKYFLMVAHNFAGSSLANIDECVVGVMERDFPKANSTWLPSTITQSMKVQGASKLCLVGVYDLITGEYIHLDLDFGNLNSYVSGGGDKFMKAISPYLELPKLSVYDLLQWHVEARGRIVQKEDAETHFLFEDFSGSYTKTLEYLGV